MVKKRGVIVVIVITLLIAFTSSYFFFSQGKLNISGMAIVDISDSLSKPNISTIAFFAQWILALIIIITAVVRHIKYSKEEKIKINYDKIKKSQGKSHTDIDLLYTMLKEKKHLKIETVSKLFSIDKDKALEWAKILENNNLARLEYPAFSNPELEIIKDEEVNSINKK